MSLVLYYIPIKLFKELKKNIHNFLNPHNNSIKLNKTITRVFNIHNKKKSYKKIYSNSPKSYYFTHNFLYFWSSTECFLLVLTLFYAGKFVIKFFLVFLFNPSAKMKSQKKKKKLFL